jgi:hypothetical protein
VRQFCLKSVKMMAPLYAEQADPFYIFLFYIVSTQRIQLMTSPLEHTDHPANTAYDPSPILKPSVNLGAWLWLIVLGAPFLLLVFIYAKL